MASSELTSCQDFVILCGFNFTFLVMLSDCSLPERFWQMSYSLMPLQNQPKLQGWKYAHPKSDFVVRLVVIAPPPFKLRYSARNRVKRKWWYNKVTQLVSSIFYHTSQYILWEKRRQTGTSTDELLQMNMFMVSLSPLLTSRGDYWKFKIMLKYFHLPAIKRVWPLHLWIKVLILEFCSVNNLEFGQTPINTFWSWNPMSPSSHAISCSYFSLLL